MQSQSNPKEFDAVLGGQSAIPASAAVMGGVQGAISRLKHGNLLTKRDALVYLKEKDRNRLCDDEVLFVLLDVCKNRFAYDMNSEWFSFFDTVAALYVNAYVIRDDCYHFLDVRVLDKPEKSVLYAIPDAHPVKYLLVSELVPIQLQYAAYFQSPKNYLLKALDITSFENFKAQIRVLKQIGSVTKLGTPYLVTDLLDDVLSPLRDYLCNPEKHSLAKVKVYSDNVAAFKLRRLLGLTWYVIFSPRQGTLLTTYVPSFEEIKNWDTRIVWD